MAGFKWCSSIWCERYKVWCQVIEQVRRFREKIIINFNIKSGKVPNAFISKSQSDSRASLWNLNVNWKEIRSTWGILGIRIEPKQEGKVPNDSINEPTLGNCYQTKGGHSLNGIINSLKRLQNSKTYLIALRGSDQDRINPATTQ